MQRTDLILDIEHEIDRIRDAENTLYIDDIETWADAYLGCIDESGETLLRNFRENYTSRQLGFVDYGTLDGTALLALLKSRGIKDREVCTLIMEHCEPADCDYYTQWNEMESVQVGETEYQYDLDGTELKRLIDLASPEERDYLRIRPLDVKQGHLLIYGNPCERIVWKLQPKTFLKAVAELLGPESEDIVV